DRRFYEHGGVDPEGILRATVRNLAGGDLEGASTLTQQYVKNVQIEESRVKNDPELYQAATETTIARKLREARLAIALEQVRSKDEILTGYLNIAQFGPSQWGVEAAAHHYFNKSAADLDIAESALLAGITQSPAKWDPVTNPENAERRRNTVLGTMLSEGFITQAEYDEAVAIPVPEMLDVPDAQRVCAAARRHHPLPGHAGPGDHPGDRRASPQPRPGHHARRGLHHPGRVRRGCGDPGPGDARRRGRAARPGRRASPGPGSPQPRQRGL